MKSHDVVLTVAGSDCSGGAGIQADIKTITVLGCYAASVINVLTAQNTQGVTNVLPVTPEFINQQFNAIYSDFMPSAIKIGMLHNEDCIRTIVKHLQVAKKNHIPIVLDPVMVAQSGSSLMQDTAVLELKKLFNYVDLITPNVPEAQELTKIKISTLNAMRHSAIKLGTQYQCAVFVKGGHLKTQSSTDVLYLPKTKNIRQFTTPVINTKNSHGTGCTLSSAVSCFLAQGNSIEKSVIKAKDFLYNTLKSGQEYQLGRGSGPVNHLYNLEKKPDVCDS